MAKVINTESRILEYKREYTKNILKTVSAFANYHDGEIIIGIDDDMNVVGIEDAVYLKLKLENAINDNISPKPYYEIKEKNIDDKTIIILKVYVGENTPYLYNNKAYKRMDTSTIAVDIYDYENLILNGRNLGYDELTNNYEDLKFDYLNKMLREKLDLSMISRDILRTLGLIKNDKYTNAAALLSDNNPISFSGISLIRFDGNSVANIKDRLFLKNISILKMYDKSIDFYKKHINTSEIIDDAYRKTIEQVPLVAYREALANAIVHRDYSYASESRVEIYDNRIEIISPGGLPIGITEEEYKDGRISISRNKILSDIFFRLGIIERMATGIRRIKEYYKNYKVNPDFLISSNVIKVVLPYINLTTTSTEQVNEGVNVYELDLNNNELLLLDYIRKNNEINRMEAEKVTGLKKTYTVEILNNLISKDIIKRVGRGRNTIYVLNK